MEQSAVLLVEDDPNLGYVLQEYLQMKHYTVTLCEDGEAGWKEFLRGAYDLCVLDVMMPKKDGFTLAKDIREKDAIVPIIFLTAKGMKEDKIEGVRAGADDYVTKPFSAEELLCRIEAVLRRTKPNMIRNGAKKKFVIGKFTFDYPQRLLSDGKDKQFLTGKEADLLRMLCENLNEVMRRDIALKQIWGDDSYFNGRSMDVFITKLRKYMKSDPIVEIVNVHGTGYKLTVAETDDVESETDDVER